MTASTIPTFMGLPKSVVNYTAKLTFTFLVGGHLSGHFISVLGHGINPLAVGLGCGTFALVNSLALITLSKQCSEHERLKEFLKPLAMAASCTMAFGVYVVANTLPIEVGLVAFLVSVVGIMVITRLSIPPEEDKKG